MKFNKFLLCLLIGILVLNFSGIHASAAETTTSQVQEEKADETSDTEDQTSQVDTEEKATYTKAELRLLSALIYCEAGSEIYRGKLAVGIVVMNRVRSKAFPDTVKDVIYQKYQFSPVRNGTLKKALAKYDNNDFTSTLEKDCIKAAKAALSGVTSFTINGEKKDFSDFLYFSGKLRGYTFKFGNHKFK